MEAAGQARAKGEGLISGQVGKTAHFVVTGTRSPPAVQVIATPKNTLTKSYRTISNGLFRRRTEFVMFC